MLNKIIHGDCLQVMNNIPVGSVQMVLCDLPYGITQNKWDSCIDLESLWGAYHRVCRGAVVLFAAQPFTSKLVCSNIDFFKYDWCWKKPRGTGHLNAKKMPMRDKEDILVFGTAPFSYTPQMTSGTPYKNKAGKDPAKTTSITDSYGAYTNYREVNTGFRYPKQVLEFGVVERGTLHPTQKPVPLCEYLIRTYTNEGDTVLDNCIGSGTTAIACLNTGRNYIGIEKEEKYWKIAEERVKAHLPTNAMRFVPGIPALSQTAPNGSASHS